MSDATNVQASIAHLVLAGTSVWSLTAAPRQEFSYFGTFGNLLFHGGIGFFHFQNPKQESNGQPCPPPKGGLVETCCGLLTADLRSIYCATCQASRLISLPCAVAHLYLKAGYRKDIAYMHVFSGLTPFIVYLLGGLLSADLKNIYCMSCQASRVLSLPCAVAHLYLNAGYRKDIACIHVISGLVPMVILFWGKPAAEVSNIVVIGNIMSLFYISLDTKNTWGMLMTGASIFSFLFVNASTTTFEMTFNTLYPFTLAFFEYCFLRTLGVNF